VPRQEIDHWIDLDDDLYQHLMGVSKSIGKALDLGFKPNKVAMMIAGLEVPHAHIHVIPVEGMHDLDADNADLAPNPDALDAAADRVRAALRALEYSEVSD
jgi:diadenosine tetraphosphate (Ap4A) HIT family hydrolase